MNSRTSYVFSPTKCKSLRKMICGAAAVATLTMAQTAQPPFYKAIWEPVNYKADVKLQDVFFVSNDVGWVAGGATETSGGVIASTQDAGATWTVQVGDPQSSDQAFHTLRFLDATHGWAMQSDRLFHTSDGQSWVQSGTLPQYTQDYTFTSERHGISAEMKNMQVTNDGGNTWKVATLCAVDAEVGGLTRRVECEFQALHFPTASVGYAATRSSLKDAFIVGKTTDGGVTWRLSVVPSVNSDAQDVFFLDDNTGYVRVGYPDTGRMYRTTDGGATWSGIAGSPGMGMRFADAEVGWAFLYGKMGYTTNGGKSWVSRTFQFPTSPRAVSLANRQRGYVAGEHGMVYRYSVVPAEYMGKGMLDAPMMPGFDLPVNAEVQKLRPQLAALQAKLQAAGAPAASAPAGGGFVQDTSTAAPLPAGAGGFAPDTPGAGKSAANPAAPCCGITSIDSRTGIVTAKDNATGRTFQFSASAAVLNSLRVGQGVYANTATKQVSVNGTSPCCGIVSAQLTGGNSAANPAAPCCGITSIDSRTGIVTAKDNVTGRTFQFSASAAVLNSLRVGQGVYANTATKQVSVNGTSPCCGTAHGSTPSDPAVRLTIGIPPASGRTARRHRRYEPGIGESSQVKVLW